MADRDPDPPSAGGPVEAPPRDPAAGPPGDRAPALTRESGARTLRPVAPPALLLAGSALAFAAMALIAKRASARLPGAEVALVRFAIGCAACAVAALRLPLRARNKAGLLLRGLFGGSAVLLYFLALEHLPAGVATLLNYTAPVFTALWAALFLGERLDGRTGAALALTTVGVALVLSGNAPRGSIGLGPWQLVGVLSAVLSGAAVATIREVRRTDGSWEVFAAFCIAGALITCVPAARHWVAPSPREWGLLSAVGLLSVAAQLVFTYAIGYARAAVAGILQQLTPVATLGFGALALGEAVPALALLGAGLALAGVTWGAFIAARPSRVPVVDDP